jgi:hypothetical protein
MSDIEFKVRFMMNDTYEVLKMYKSEDYGEYEYDDSESVFQGSLADCEAYLRLTESGYM